jgi:hypothetical protein
LLFLGYHVMTFKRWGDEFPYVLRFLVCFAAMIVELLWENIMVWCVDHSQTTAFIVSWSGGLKFAGPQAVLLVIKPFVFTPPHMHNPTHCYS